MFTTFLSLLACLPPQQTKKGTFSSIVERHSTHFFMTAAHVSQVTMCRHGLNKTVAELSEHTRQSPKTVLEMAKIKIYNFEAFPYLSSTYSLQSRHFFTLGEHPEQTVICPQGAKSTFLR